VHEKWPSYASIFYHIFFQRNPNYQCIPVLLPTDCIMKQKTINSSIFVVCSLLSLPFFFSSCSNDNSKTADGYLIRMNLEEGQNYPLAMNMKITVNQEAGPLQGDISMDIASAFDYKVEDVHDTTYDISLTYNDMDMSMKMMGQTMSFSSKNKTSGDMVSQLLQVMTENDMNMVMSHRGAVLEVKNMDGYFDKIMAALGDGVSPDQKQQIMSQVEQSFGEKGLRGSMETFMQVYPDHRVNVGDSWTTSSTLSASTEMDMTSTYTLEQVTEKFYVLKMKADLSANQIDEFSGAKIQMNGTMTGTMNVDRKTGWISNGELIQDISGKTIMPANEMTPEATVIPMKITGEIIFE
jgi:hypothetical protein